MPSLGLSFGKKKQSGTSTGTMTGVTDLTGSQTTNSTQAGSTNTTGTTTGTQTQSGTQTGTTIQDQSQTNQGTNRTQGLTTSLGSDVIDTLSQTVKSVLGNGVNPGNIAALSDMIGGKAGFDKDAFVSGIVDQARGRGEQTLQEQNSAFASRAGGTAGTNSAAALLAQRGRNDLESNIAGIQAQARGQAEGIENQNLGTAIEAQSGIAGIGAALAEAAKGGQTTTDVTQLTDEISKLLGQTGTTGATTQTGTSTEQSTTQTNQLLAQIAEVLTQQRENTSQTENVVQKGKSSGFGISAGM